MHRKEEETNMTKNEFRTDRIVTVINDDGEVKRFYPTGEEEFNDCVESYVQDLWYGDCIKVIAEYNTIEKGFVIRHTMVYTEYGKKPEVSSIVIG